MRGVLSIFGLLMIGFGLLVLWRPEVLNYLVAGLFIFIGVSVIAAAWSAGSRVTYRRFDQVWRGPPEE